MNNEYEKQISDLKKINENLIKENFDLKDTLQKTSNIVTSLRKENAYLKEHVKRTGEIIAELKNDYAELEKRHNDSFKDFERLRQECEELKEILDDFITDNKSLYQYDGRQPSNLTELQECMQSSMDAFQKYKQALDEIEGFIEVASGECRISEMEWNSIQDIINKARKE